MHHDPRGGHVSLGAHRADAVGISICHARALTVGLIGGCDVATTHRVPDISHAEVALAVGLASTEIDQGPK